MRDQFVVPGDAGNRVMALEVVACGASVDKAPRYLASFAFSASTSMAESIMHCKLRNESFRY